MGRGAILVPFFIASRARGSSNTNIECGTTQLVRRTDLIG